MKVLPFTMPLLLIATVLVTVVCTYPVRADSDAPIPFHDSAVAVYSPVNMTYNGNNLVLNLSLGSAGYMGGLDSKVSMNYSIDGLYTGVVPLRSDGEIHIITRAIAYLSLPKLTDGPHNLTLHLYGLNERTAEPRYLTYTNTVYFSTTGNPSVNITPTSSPTAIPSSSQPLSPTPAIPELSWLAVISLSVVFLCVAVIVRHWNNSNSQPYKIGQNHLLTFDGSVLFGEQAVPLGE